MSRRTLVPEGLDPPLTTFLDTMARAALPVSAVADLSGAASATSGAVTTSAIAAVATTGSTDVTPFGFTTAAQADALVAAVNLLVTRIGELTMAVNTLRSDNATNAVLLDSAVSKINAALAAFRAAGRMST